MANCVLMLLSGNAVLCLCDAQNCTKVIGHSITDTLSIVTDSHRRDMAMDNNYVCLPDIKIGMEQEKQRFQRIVETMAEDLNSRVPHCRLCNVTLSDWNRLATHCASKLKPDHLLCAYFLKTYGGYDLGTEGNNYIKSYIEGRNKLIIPNTKD